MSEKTPTPQTAVSFSDSSQLIYILYLCGSVTFGMTALLGLVWVYFEQGHANETLKTHYTFLTHTFWKGLLIFVLGGFTIFFFVGFLIWIFWFFWLTIRVLKGWKALRAGAPIEKPKRWGF